VDGDVAEADSANLFAVVEGDLLTPPLDRGVLPGVTRARCLEALPGVAREGRIARDALARASEVFLTSSLDGVTPVVAVDGRALVNCPGPVARWLARCLSSRDATAGEFMRPHGTRPQNEGSP
jgi:branched-subunit amino acid aminotransferase/4-amino-4-deoxychorismate lyase